MYMCLFEQRFVGMVVDFVLEHEDSVKGSGMRKVAGDMQSYCY